MSKSVVPMIHVPDVRATVDWYQSIGFTVVATYGDDTGEGLSFAIISFGDTQVMFNEEGETSTKHRREVDLYVYTDEVDELYERLKDRVDVVKGPHDTFYGMREVIIRDLNRFWITFAQESFFAMLISGVNEGKPEAVRNVVQRGQLSLETLNIALSFASTKQNADVIEVLKNAGATALPQVDLETLESYVGKYKGDHGFEVEVTVMDGRLFATPPGQHPVSLWPLNDTTFKPIALEGATLIFNFDERRVAGFTFQQHEHKMELKKASPL